MHGVKKETVISSKIQILREMTWHIELLLNSNKRIKQREYNIY